MADALAAAGGHHAHAGEDALAGYLQEARRLLASRPDRPEEGPTGLPADFEALRWFPCRQAAWSGPPRGWRPEAGRRLQTCAASSCTADCSPRSPRVRRR
jgi:hypothetical protein